MGLSNNGIYDIWNKQVCDQKTNYLRLSQSMFYHASDDSSETMQYALDFAILTLLWGSTTRRNTCELSIVDIGIQLGYKYIMKTRSQQQTIYEALKRLNSRQVAQDTIIVRFYDYGKFLPSEKIVFRVCIRPIEKGEVYVSLHGDEINKMVNAAIATSQKYQNLLMILVCVKRYMRTIDWRHPTEGEKKCSGSYIHLERIADDMNMLMKTVMVRFDVLERAGVFYTQPIEGQVNGYYVCDTQHPNAFKAVKTSIRILTHGAPKFISKQKKHLF